jgi:hypothetical protein
MEWQALECAKGSNEEEEKRGQSEEKAAAPAE